MKPGISFDCPLIPSDPANWLPAYPNPADFRFDYFKLMQNSPLGLAEFPTDSPRRRVAIIGGGAAGMTVARELYRCGCDITIFEASDRIGGRLYTHNNPNGLNQAGMEMGAMRMPFFTDLNSENSLLGYYLNYEVAGTHPLKYASFPNPGAAKGGTGIYINRGHGPRMVYPKPRLINWPYGGVPENPDLALLTKKVTEFGNNFNLASTKYYSVYGPDWDKCWGKMVAFYDDYTFGDLVVLKALSTAEIEKKLENLDTFDGDLGGMGMTQEQSDLLATIGTGDGSWGAFFTIAALWFIRCTYFGFSTNLQTIEGLSNPEKFPNLHPPFKDSAGQPLAPPRFEGIQSLAEYLFYAPAPGTGKSLYETAKLFVSCPVSLVTKREDVIELTVGADHRKLEFDEVVITTTQWAAEMSMEFIGFQQDQLPQAKITTQNTQHNISSCKLFFPLKEKYWEKADNRIPQIIVTDTIVQDLYGLTWGTKEADNGVVLASYTWEDDSLKLLPFDEKELSRIVMSKLRQITMETVGQDITEHFDHSKPVTIQWIEQPTYVGCAKLYRTRNQDSNMLDLSYNQNYSAESKLYFAGENYSVEGGWTEPALRSGLDCVMQYLHHNKAIFKTKDFNFGLDYPKWPPKI
ncbi:MAG TPA: FAD-dependent oxidoreductase [Fluviicola sp.]|nr:FAD-dependent oxidoreductase [Fluviicola sp.]